MEIEFKFLLEKIKKLSPEKKKEIYFQAFKSIIEDERDIIIQNYQQSLKELEHDKLKFSFDVDELKRLIENGLKMGPEPSNIIEIQSPEIIGDNKILSSSSFNLPPDKLDLIELELNIVRKAFEKCGGNKSETARYLCLTRGQLRSRLSMII